jgi:hypothetical protein
MAVWVPDAARDESRSDYGDCHRQRLQRSSSGSNGDGDLSDASKDELVDALAARP